MKYHENRNEGIEMDIKTESPLHILVPQIGFQQEFVGDPPEARCNHESNSDQINEYHIDEELDESPKMNSQHLVKK